MAEKFKINRLYVMPEASFGVDPSATGSGYSFVKAIEPTFQATVEVVERPGETGDLTRQPHVMGVKGGTVAFKLELKGSGTPATAAATAPESSPLLIAALGTRVIGTGTTVLASPAPTVNGFSVTSAAGLAVGMAIEVGTGGPVRFIRSITGAAITLHRALPSAPATGAIVYASNLYRRASSGHGSVAIVAIKDNVQYTFLGCKVKVTIEGITAKGTALLNFAIDAATYSRTTKAALPSSDVAGITAVRAPIVKGSPLDIDGVTRSAVGIDFDPGIVLNFQETLEADDAKAGIDIVESAPKGTVRPYYNVANMTDFEAGTEREIAIACGDRTNGFGLFLPKCQFLQPSFVERNGTLGEDVPFAVNDNGTAAEFMLSLF